MERDNDIVEKVNNTNTEFYRAIENLSIEMIDNLWKHQKCVCCIIIKDNTVIGHSVNPLQ